MNDPAVPYRKLTPVAPCSDQIPEQPLMDFAFLLLGIGALLALILYARALARL